MPRAGDRGNLYTMRSATSDLMRDAVHAQLVLLTASERSAYERELWALVDERDRELPERLREARTYVAADAVEEIAQIQDDQAIADRRIARLQELLGNATTIPDAEGAGVVSVGSVVTIEYVPSGRRATYRLTGRGSAGAQGSVSARSPVGRALMGRPVGAVVSAELPGRRRAELRIVDVDVG
jgi:transcription elongation factor GreA